MAQTILVLGGGYGGLNVALGSETDHSDIPGLKENSFGLKSIEEAWLLREHIKKLLSQASEVSSEERRAMLTFVVGGGGFTGVEMAGELADWLPDLGHGRHRSFQFSPTGDVISLGRNEAIATFDPIAFDGYQARLLKETIALRYYHRIGGPGLTLRKLPGSWRATGFGPRALFPGL